MRVGPERERAAVGLRAVERDMRRARLFVGRAERLPERGAAFRRRVAGEVPEVAVVGGDGHVDRRLVRVRDDDLAVRRLRRAALHAHDRAPLVLQRAARRHAAHDECAVLHRARRRTRGLDGHLERNGVGPVCRGAVDHHVIRETRKCLAREADTSAREFRARHGVIERKRPAVVLRFAFRQDMADPKVAERLVG